MCRVERETRKLHMQISLVSGDRYLSPCYTYMCMKISFRHLLPPYIAYVFFAFFIKLTPNCSRAGSTMSFVSGTLFKNI